MKKRTWLYVLGSFISLLVIIYYVGVGIEESRYRKNASSLIEAIEQFRSAEGRLPDCVAEMGIEETDGWGPYYEKKDSCFYEVYYCIGFDDYYVFSSKDSLWKWKP